MKKKIIFYITSLALILINVIALICLEYIPGEKYVYLENTDSYELDYVYGYHETYMVKAYYEGKPVTRVGKRAFKTQSHLKSVTFEANSCVNTIELTAFEEVTSLEKITLPESLVEIEQNAFLDCYNLKEVVFQGDNFQYLGGSSFFNCYNLDTIDLPTSTTVIGSMAFYNCKSLKEISIYENVTKLYNDVFYNCESLEVINLYITVENYSFLGNLNKCIIKTPQE